MEALRTGDLVMATTKGEQKIVACDRHEISQLRSLRVGLRLADRRYVDNLIKSMCRLSRPLGIAKSIVAIGP